MGKCLMLFCAAILLLTAMPEPKQTEASVILANQRGFNRNFNRGLRRNQIVIQPQFNRLSNRGFNNQLRLNNQLLQQQLLQQQLLNQQQFQPFGLNGCF